MHERAEGERETYVTSTNIDVILRLVPHCIRLLCSYLTFDSLFVSNRLEYKLASSACETRRSDQPPTACRTALSF